MVPARNLQPLLRDAHATPCAAAAAATGLGVTPTASSHMAQEPIDKHHSEPTKPPPPPQERQEADQDTRHHAHVHGEQQQQLTLRPLQPAGSSHQEVAGTSGSSSGGSSGNGGAGDWLRLSLAPASPGSAAGTQPGVVFAPDHAAGAPPLLLSSQPQPRTTTAAEALPVMGMGVPPGPFLHQAAPGIPQASIALPVPRAGPPWLPPWSPSAVAPPPPSLIPFGFGHRAFYTPGAGASGLDMIRVVLPPSAVAAAAGVWFALQAAPHQGREPFLPQIPRSYLRIKDGRVTVRLLIKYLAGKLGLEDESEVEITCRGRQLPAFLTLQHVRDGIWCQGDAAASPSVVPDMSSANHLMVLQYGRRP
ncbi:protein LAX PANICLE 2-like [Miscanthus floridulus]|uniref:protein LAX PANICLE 2-like n=1 Tax=Miscanthus floridulus TaxID=154761 RepID=UPI00345799BD